MLLSRIWSVAFVTLKVTPNLGNSVKAYCWQNYKRSPYGQRHYSSENTWVRPIRHAIYVAYETIGTDPVLFWNGWKPILVGTIPKYSDPYTKSGSGGSDMASVTFIRGTFAVDAFLNQCVDAYNQIILNDGKSKVRKNGRFGIYHHVGMGRRYGGGKTSVGEPGQPCVTTNGLPDSIESGEYRLLKWKPNEIGPDIIEDKKALDALAFPAIIDEIILEFEYWLKSKDWYRERQLPWTRGWAIFGAAGTGKSALVRAMGQDYDLPIHLFDLASMSNEEFLRFWGQMANATPCIALFEDLDAVFHGRENITGENGGGLTFDCFLNAMSGVTGADGGFKIMTTNHIEHFDPALGIPQKDANGKMGISTRPGRDDLAIEVPVLDASCRLKIARRILNDCPQYIDTVVLAGE